MKYKVVSTKWNTTIEDGFDSYEAAKQWATENCRGFMWEDCWTIEQYNPDPWLMKYLYD